MKLKREERQYWHKPFWGLSGATPQVQVGAGQAWAAMTAAPSFVPGSDWSAPTGVTGNPDWYQVLLAGPDATDNPAGTIVVVASSRIRTKVVAGDEIDILPDDTEEWITLVS